MTRTYARLVQLRSHQPANAIAAHAVVGAARLVQLPLLKVVAVPLDELLELRRHL